MDPLPSPAARGARVRRASGNFLSLAWQTPSSPDGAGLIMAVAKKRVPNAPGRALCRRVIREAWRAALVRSDLLPYLRVQVQLHTLPQDTAAPTVDVRGRPVSAWHRRLTHRALKQVLRRDADALFTRVVGGLTPRRPA